MIFMQPSLAKLVATYGVSDPNGETLIMLLKNKMAWMLGSLVGLVGFVSMPDQAGADQNRGRGYANRGMYGQRGGNGYGGRSNYGYRRSVPNVYFGYGYNPYYNGYNPYYGGYYRYPNAYYPNNLIYGNNSWPVGPSFGGGAFPSGPSFGGGGGFSVRGR
jgi:hypothetical protein